MAFDSEVSVGMPTSKSAF